jgi:branched-chain amino acid transport system substrate-binding protein
MPDTDRPNMFRRRRLLRRTGAGLGAVAFAGCQSTDDDAAAGGDDTTSTADGVVGDLSGQTITLGLLPPDEVSDLGAPMVNCMELAVDQLNADGGLLGADVEYTVGPTNLSVAHARKEYTRMTQEAGVDATFGILLQLRSLMESIADAETLHLTCGNPDSFASRLVSRSTSPIDGDPAEEYERFRYHFRYGPPNVDQSFDALNEGLRLYADQLGWNRVAVYLADLSMLEGIPGRIQEAAGDIIEVPIAELVPDGLDDFSPLWDRAEAEDVDVVAMALALGAPTAVAQWANQRREFGLGGLLLGAGNSDFWDESGGLAEGMWTAEMVVPKADLTEYTQPFIQAYRDAYGSVPGVMGPLVYDAVRLYADAVRAVGSTDPEALIPHLEEMTWTRSIAVPTYEFHGPEHEFAHDPVFNCISPETCDDPAGVPLLAQWQSDGQGGGTQEVFAPEQHKTADYRNPPWM